MNRELPPNVVDRAAIVYVRQSTGAQVRENLESQRRQYDLAELAREYGFRDVRVIDDDLGLSASGTMDRPGFRSLVGLICEGVVGAVFCLEASRLARNGRDWHHLLELCGLVGARVIDGEAVYDPGSPNDRLLLGLKGTMSEFELTVLRRRLLDAAIAKARRGELRMPVPVGYVWSRETGLVLDPDRRVQDAVRMIFRLFERFGSARQVLLHMSREQVLFPRPADGKQMTSAGWCWRSACYRNVISVLQNPFYAGAYAYGKATVRTKIVEGAVRKSYGHRRPMEEWTVLLRDHHEAYVGWEQFERTQVRLARNSFSKPAGGAKSGRGGPALLAGLLRCRRCGRMLLVTYGGHGVPQARYTCRMGNSMHGLDPCITFGASRPDDAIASEIVLAVQPHAVEAAVVAARDAATQIDERRRALELERQQAAYEAKLAARRYESVDPDNRLVAAELEARWNAAITRLRECEARMATDAVPTGNEPPTAEALLTLAADLRAAWNAPTTTMRTKQRLVRALVEEIVVDVDDATREVVLVIHWRGGRHSELRVRKPSSGEHRKRASAEADSVIREMAGTWSDEHIAATLNRIGLRTGQGLTWNKRRVESYRKHADIPAYAPAANPSEWVTMRDAAKHAGVSSHFIRRLIQLGVLPAKQVVPDAPWQIRLSDLDNDAVRAAIARRHSTGRPCEARRDTRTLVIPGT
jgi:DNA invertase Pin-like site-specific DNA recombinase